MVTNKNQTTLGKVITTIVVKKINDQNQKILVLLMSYQSKCPKIVKITAIIIFIYNPKQRQNIQNQYELMQIDCTGTPHNNKNLHKATNGNGRNNMAMIAKNQNCTIDM